MGVVSDCGEGTNCVGSAVGDARTVAANLARVSSLRNVRRVSTQLVPMSWNAAPQRVKESVLLDDQW